MSRESSGAEAGLLTGLAVDEFADGDPGRSAGIASLRGPQVSALVRADVPRPGASVIKLPLVAAVHGAARAGAIDLDARVRASDLPTTSYRSMLAAFDPDHEFSLRELCALCLVTSDNPIADHLLGRVGTEAVNRQAALWGCRTTRLTVGFGDNFLGDAGRANVTTVRDALLMIRALMRRPLRLEVMRPLAHNLRNFRIPLRLPDDLEVPHKTGSLAAVANDVGAVLGVRSDVAVAFLCDEQVDTGRTSLEIGDCVAKVWSALGEELA